MSILKIKQSNFISFPDAHNSKGEIIRNKKGEAVKDTRAALNMKLRGNALKATKAYIKHRNSMAAILAKKA